MQKGLPDQPYVYPDLPGNDFKAFKPVKWSLYTEMYGNSAKNPNHFGVIKIEADNSIGGQPTAGTNAMRITFDRPVFTNVTTAEFNATGKFQIRVTDDRGGSLKTEPEDWGFDDPQTVRMRNFSGDAEGFLLKVVLFEGEPDSNIPTDDSVTSRIQIDLSPVPLKPMIRNNSVDMGPDYRMYEGQDELTISGMLPGPFRVVDANDTSKFVDATAGSNGQSKVQWPTKFYTGQKFYAYQKYGPSGSDTVALPIDTVFPTDTDANFSGTATSPYATVQHTKGDLKPSGVDLPGWKTTITGTGTTPGNKIIFQNPKTNSEQTAIVQPDKTFSLDVGTTLNDLFDLKADGDQDTIKLQESSVWGDGDQDFEIDVKYAVPLFVIADKTDLDITPSDLADHDNFKDPAVALDTLVQLAGIKVDPTKTKPVGTVTYQFNDADIADRLKLLQTQGSTTTVSISGVEGKGAMKQVLAPIVLNLKATSGMVKFGKVSDTVSFGDQQLTSATEILKRDSEFVLNVMDDRSRGNTWQLSAKATPFISTDGKNNVLPADIIYKADDQAKPLILQGASQVILTQTSTDTLLDPKTNTINLSEKWTPKSGLLVENYPGGLLGSYSSTIEWTLADVPVGP